MISKFFRFLSLLLCLAAIPLHARAAEHESGRYFRTMGVGVTAPDLYYSRKGKDKSITLTDEVRSVLYGWGESPRVAFYRIATGPDGKPARLPVADAEMGNAGKLSLLLFTPAPKVPGGCEVQVLPDDLESFPLGAYRVINRSAIPLKISMGHQTVEVKPYEIQCLKYAPPAGGEGVPVRVRASAKEGKRLLYADTWGSDAQCRTEILIAPRAGASGLISVSRLRDNPAPLLRTEYLPKE